MHGSYYLVSDQFGFARSIEHTIISNTVEDAEDGFVDAKERLLDVKNWKRYTGRAGVEFLLKDSHDRAVHRKAHKGDHIKMNIVAEGIDICLVIDALEYDDYPDLHMETFTMRLHPCGHGLAHDDDANSEVPQAALVIERRHKHLFASFTRRNVANSTNDENTGRFGLSDTDWNNLLKRFVD